MALQRHHAGPGPNRRSHRRLAAATLLALSAAAAFLLIPALAGTPARLVHGCGRWIVTAAALELLSAAGFIVVFKLVFAAPLSWSESVPAAMRALGAITVLPGGGLVGPALGGWSATSARPSRSQLTRSTISFLVLTNAPGVIVLGAVGGVLWLGLADGPHGPALTILPALLAAGAVAGAWLAAHRACHPAAVPGTALGRALAAPARTMRAGLTQACALVSAGDWKLSGAVGYYVFDNAVLWAAFRAFGNSPPIGIVVMGYLVGSLAGALPLPAGLGVLDGGLIGALILYGSPAAPAAAAVLLYRAISLLLPTGLGALGLMHSWRQRVHRVPTRFPPRSRTRLGAARLDES